MIPKLPVDFNSDSAFETLKFITDHYEDLMSAYKDIMEHLKLPVAPSTGGETQFEEVTVTNSKPMYITIKCVDSLPYSYRTTCYFGSPVFESGYLTNDTVYSEYIRNLVGANYSDEIVPQDYTNNYFLRIYRDGVEIDYDEYSYLRGSDYENDWEGLELRLFRMNRNDQDISHGEDLGEFVSAVEALFTPTESVLKPTEDEIFRNLQIQNENYLVNKTDTPYTYAIDCANYYSRTLILNGGTYSSLGTVETSNGCWLGVSSGCSYSGSTPNHFYVYLLVSSDDYSSYPTFYLETYTVEDDNTPFTFRFLVSKDKIDNRR